MLVEDLLLQRFKEETTGRNYAKGQRIINNDLVESVEIEDEEDLVAVNGIVISEQFPIRNSSEEFETISRKSCVESSFEPK